MWLLVTCVASITAAAVPRARSVVIAATHARARLAVTVVDNAYTALPDVPRGAAFTVGTSVASVTATTVA